MRPENCSTGDKRAADDAFVAEAAGRLRLVVVELAARLRPFPAFLNMVSVQALELDPPSLPSLTGAGRGCVVVLPDGEICELVLEALPGIAGITEADQAEEYRTLDLPAHEYVVYAAEAIYALYRELRRRGQ
ncbi:MAG: hypothetical protein AAB528_05350 [Chloroflexota bacterium]